MIKRVELKIGNGFFDIVYGDSFSVECKEAPFLCYAENDIWHVVSNPEPGENCNAVITLPKGIKLEGFSIQLYDGAANICELDSGTADIEVKNASAEFTYIKARRISAKLGRGSMIINTQPLVAADFNCGFGEMIINLKKGNYRLKSLKGNGRVSIDSSAVPREFESGKPDGIQVNIRCGLGNVDVNFI